MFDDVALFARKKCTDVYDLNLQVRLFQSSGEMNDEFYILRLEYFSCFAAHWEGARA